MSCPIEDYALIGDCETAALVGNDGSIDWLCWPRFDSGACFAAILGTPEHGRWKIAPATSATRVTRHYRKGTLILETEFETEHGTVTIIDFMPLRERQSDLVDCRKVTITSCYASKLVWRQTAKCPLPATNIPNSAALLNRVPCLRATSFAPSSS